jgi:hypothetical protein
VSEMRETDEEEPRPIDLVRADLSRAPDSDARLAILLRAVEAHPEVGELRWLLYQHYVGIGEHAAAQRQLASGLARGEREFVLEQARSYPESLSGAAFDALAREDPVLAAACEIARGEAVPARARLERVVEDSSAVYRSRGLPRDVWLDVVAIALERDATELARWMLEVLAAGGVRFEVASDARHDRDALAALESGLRALLALPPHVPRPYRAAFARALRAATPEAATAAIQAVRRDGADDGAQVHRDLARAAPELASRFRRALVGKLTVSESEARAGHSPWHPLRWFLVSAALLLFAARAACSPPEDGLRRRTIEAEAREREAAERRARPAGHGDREQDPDDERDER